jgi:hypothetical protein
MNSARSTTPRRSILLWVAAGLAWVGMIGTGFGLLYVHAFTPGERGLAGERWPTHSTLKRADGSYSIVVVAHPECPCSRATVEELAVVMASGQSRVTATVLFLDEPGLPEAPESSELWQRASRIPGVAVVKDPQGREARQFGARTSGETRLYSPSGELLFHGGITGSRGHEGDNPGEEAIVAFVAGRMTSPVVRSTPVFGCALFETTVASTP